MGKLGMIQSTVGMFSALAGMGLGLAATKHIAEYRSKNPVVAGEIIGFVSLVSWLSGALMTLLVVLLAPWLARVSLSAPELTPQLEVGSLLLFFGVINGVQTGVLSGFEAFKTIAKVNVITGILNFLILVSAAYFAGLPGVIGGLVAGLAINCGLNFLAVRQQALASGIRISFRNLKQRWALLWQFGLPGMLSGFIAGPVGWITGATLVRQPGGFAEMGIYNATNSWFQAVAFLPDLLAQVLLPILASYNADKDQHGADRALRLSTWANVIIVIPVILVGSVLSPWIMGWYGPGFAQGWPVMVLTMLSAGVLMVQGPLANQMIADSRMWAYFWAHVGWALVFVAGTFWWVPSLGAAGLGTARLIAFITNGLFVLAVFWWGKDKSKTLAAH